VEEAVAVEPQQQPVVAAVVSQHVVAAVAELEPAPEPQLLALPRRCLPPR